MRHFAQVCDQAVRAAGAVLMDKLGTVAAQEKGRADLVTEADIAAERTVCRIVLEAFPDHGFLGEESTERPATASGDQGSPVAGYRWIADPLDGTTNYVHQVPHFSVSLALEKDGELLVGAVFHPSLDECFWAIRGEGAWLNGRPIHVSDVRQLAQGLMAVGFPPGETLNSPDVQLFQKLVGRCQAIRRTGSAALNLAYIAAGRFDGFCSFSTKIWDCAAGVLLIEEAGGKVTSPDGGPFRVDEAHFVAGASEPLHAELMKLVARP